MAKRRFIEAAQKIGAAYMAVTVILMLANDLRRLSSLTEHFSAFGVNFC
jgi:hypothetical protein